MLAAVSDFRTADGPQSGKIPSSAKTLKVELVPAEKLVCGAEFRTFPFRFAAKLTKDALEDSQQDLKRLAQTSDAHFIYWNTIEEAFGTVAHCGRIWSTSTPIAESTVCQSKSAAARDAVALLRSFDSNHQKCREP
jgi:hypothetical protein